MTSLRDLQKDTAENTQGFSLTDLSADLQVVSQLCRDLLLYHRSSSFVIVFRDFVTTLLYTSLYSTDYFQKPQGGLMTPLKKNREVMGLQK